MPYIVLTEEQARVVAQAAEPVDVRDEQGRTVARLIPLDPADIEDIQKSKASLASGKPSVPSERVQALLRKFDEIDQGEGLDEAKAEELLRRLFAGEAL
jgi:hypothetical protein